MANDHMALRRAATMGIHGAMSPPLSGEEDRRSSHMETGRPILSLTSNCLDARAYLFSCSRRWFTCELIVVLLCEHLPIACIDDIADAICGAAETGEICIVFGIIRIVVPMCQFFSFLDIA